MTEHEPTALAIIGGGPRAVYALEALARRRDTGGLPDRIDVYEPRPQLGTGMAYSPDQPDWVSLNVPDHAVHAGRVHTGAALTDSPLAGPFAPALPADDQPCAYPARAAAGRYLTALADTAIRALAPTPVRHHRRRVIRVQPTSTGLRVHTAEGSADYDAVLLVTGHAETWPGLDLPAGVPSVRVFPVPELVATAQSLRPSTVQIRGAHLSAIDAVLALSEGLGGRFTSTGDGGADHLGYHPGPVDPVLTLTSRTGRLMFAKTDAAVLRGYRSEQVAAPFLTEIATTAELPVLLERIAAAILTQARRTWNPSSAVVSPEAIHPVWERLTGPVETDPFEDLRASLAYARGAAVPDETWALGQAWRHAYPDLVRRQRLVAARALDDPDRAAVPAGNSGGGPLDWADYPRLVTGLDRLAFGPPPANVAKLITLAEAGRLHLVRTAELPAELPDLIVDAVTAPPGLPRGDELWEHLLASGLVRLGATGRGVVTDAAGACLGADGSRNGLAAVGRMTEDVVIGTDTLLRSLHPELELWADRLVTTSGRHVRRGP